uniref:G domain-containing protein n=1 Tax=Dunaliella tertiolecta TaxID=3047 RepID=A0A7S3R0I0_DUNTE|mmetsp:Transcript_17242/g.45156  ORF Transcript_17242/g.45156 Transcript_17242/m.45156 type:complete len:685 (-) Transcript_17242:545-2599(-)|eukprot:CAMPEP_0202379144 /NCGR_PEP_ID=MMETSP1127-20130417/22957_1 /ASSEMBLY_ACC=CAM_ASM_000462 /TAXON_ID=3047 /ORGANISM="Dunaliella tertiolecta, Strain CCMP1320" /LENGTH=684 /DNA_ID=CAMNT_0048977605 /DNA_START=24 /DNA_END=2078 /DNA_ORIENTATION=-
MTKHNGKSRSSGLKVGQSIINRQKQGKANGEASGRHTTETAPKMQSVLDRNDLDEFMAMADMAGRDFTAERSNVIVVSTGAVEALSDERAAEERAEAEARHAHTLRLPRRPSWSQETTPDQLEEQERSMFVNWRRGLAKLEEEEKLVLTPFEKNLEVWRQLWRVLERSDIVVQVVDARDPLLYRSTDLEGYARDLHASKTSLVLLNKADLLPVEVREAWADYFDKAGLQYAFWSAAAAILEHAALRAEAAELGYDSWLTLRKERHQEKRLRRIAAEAAAMQQRQHKAPEAAAKDDSEMLRATRTAILDEDELLELFESRARQAIQSAGPDDPRAKEPNRRFMIGLVGYPNVGKSSTINAIVGSKKTAVAPTPGKTKHFQTLMVSPTVCLCDCPGLVLPKFARSRAEMVAAGVVPIDRLTDIRGPVEVVASRCGRKQVEHVYGLALPQPAPHLPRDTPPTASQLLGAFAVLRGWTVGHGLPDESRAGRQLLKDYTAGKLVHCLMPPGSNPAAHVPGITSDLPPRTPAGHAPTPAASTTAPSQGGGSSVDSQVRDSSGSSRQGPAASQAIQPGAAQVQGQQQQQQQQQQGVAVGGGAEAPGPPGSTAPPLQLDEADLDLLMNDLDLGAGAVGAIKQRVQPQKRAAHKFQKKAARSKGDRGQIKDGGYDGAPMTTGRKGGLVRVTGC